MTEPPGSHGGRLAIGVRASGSGVSMDMLLERYGLRVRPFQPGADLTFLWLGAMRREILAALRAGVLRRDGLLVMTGEVGSGKTLLAHALVADLGNAALVARVPYPDLDPVDWFALIADAWGFEAAPTTREAFLQRVNRFLEEASAGGRAPLVLVDEAQSLRRELFAEINHLLGLGGPGAGVAVLLVGQHDLSAVLAAPEHAELRRRLSLRRHLGPLTGDEVAAYVRHRLERAGCQGELFTSEAVREVAIASHGTPRVINTVCDLALWRADRANVNPIDASFVRDGTELRGTLGRGPAGRTSAAPSSPALSASSPEAVRPAAPSVPPSDVPAGASARSSEPEPVTEPEEQEPDDKPGDEAKPESAGWLARSAVGAALALLVVGAIYVAGRYDVRSPTPPTPPASPAGVQEDSGVAAPVAPSSPDSVPAAVRLAAPTDGPVGPPSNPLPAPPVFEREVQRPARGPDAGEEPPSALAVQPRTAPALEPPLPSPRSPLPRSRGPSPLLVLPEDTPPPSGPPAAPPRPVGRRMAPAGVPVGPPAPSLQAPPPPAPRVQDARPVAPPPTDAGGTPGRTPERAVESAEAPDPGAIIDWLLREYPARRP